MNNLERKIFYLRRRYAVLNNKLSNLDKKIQLLKNECDSKIGYPCVKKRKSGYDLLGNPVKEYKFSLLPTDSINYISSRELRTNITTLFNKISKLDKQRQKIREEKNSVGKKIYESSKTNN